MAKPLLRATCWLLLLYLPFSTFAGSTREQALDYLNNSKIPDSSVFWPNVKHHLFIENLQANITAPLAIYQGSNTNFCGYAALSYLPLQADPLTYTKFMIALYIDGKASWGRNSFTPSPEILHAAGWLRGVSTDADHL